MASSTDEEREVRAARNQALFREINETLVGVNEAFATLTDTFTITCECADRGCIETIVIDPDEYRAIRAEPRRFAVRPGHVYPEVEQVVGEADEYVVVEKNPNLAAILEHPTTMFDR